MQLKLSNAKDVLKDSGASQEKVDKATADLIAAIKSLISKKNINPTILYEALNTTWRWWQGELSNTTGTPVSADNCTAITWDAYEKAKADGQALLDSLYDDKGNPVDGVNTADKQDTIDAAAETVDAHKLVNADLYNTAYENYLSSKAEAEALIEQYNPTKLNESDYSAESWAAYVSAYNVLKADMEYRIVGGTTEDYAMLKAFKGYYAYNESGQWTHYPAHIDALKDARKQLVSNKDVTVSFTYINNFSALYEGFRGNGTDLYANASLGLTSGNATLGAAFDAAGITVDMHNDSTVWIQPTTATQTRCSRSMSTAAITGTTAGLEKQAGTMFSSMPTTLCAWCVSRFRCLKARIRPATILPLSRCFLRPQFPNTTKAATL